MVSTKLPPLPPVSRYPEQRSNAQDDDIVARKAGERIAHRLGSQGQFILMDNWRCAGELGPILDFPVQTHILSAVGHRSHSTHTQKK